ncbi:MAG: L-lysine 6-transaminase, partial [Bacteroidia bacterium]|nr:L-lysine 6-transaminase [Bacteroidia bacterium]
MYHNTIQPTQVDTILKKHILKDGFDLTLDLDKSQGCYMFDSKHQRKLLDFFTCFASLPLGY